MAGFVRQLGANIYTLMRKRNMAVPTLAERTGLSVRDVYRTIEGKLLLSPDVLQKLASALDTTPESLTSETLSEGITELEYMKAFKQPENLDKVLDILDDYVELKEAI